MEKKIQITTIGEEPEVEHIENTYTIKLETYDNPSHFNKDIRIGFLTKTGKLIKEITAFNVKRCFADEHTIYSNDVDDFATIEAVAPNYKELYEQAIEKYNHQRIVIESYKRVIKDLLEIDNDN